MVAMLGLLLAPFVQPRPAAAAVPALPAWTGSVDLYSKGTFTTQRTWSWCTAAGVQIVRNIVEGDEDHSTSGQRTYFEWMRQRNRYDVPSSDGVDPVGWTAGLRHFVDDRYRLVASRTFDGALRSAVKRLRLTNLPVALTVARGGHGWILTGFAATADPARTSSFTVTSVRVVGPLYGRQSKNGYDMPPNTKLTPAQLRRFFTPWGYAPLPMIWDGLYVSIQPVPSTVVPTRVAPPSPSPRRSGFGAPQPLMAEPSAPPGPTEPPSATPLLAAAAASSSPRPRATAVARIMDSPETRLTSDAGSIADPVLVVAVATLIALALARGLVRLRPGRRSG